MTANFYMSDSMSSVFGVDKVYRSVNERYKLQNGNLIIKPSEVLNTSRMVSITLMLYKC